MTEGERWARELLAELRDAGVTARAWHRFVARSLVRARERRAERLRAHRQALALAAAGLAGWTGVATAGRWHLAAAGAAWWLLVVLMLDWHLGMLERPDGRQLRGLGRANLLSIARAGIVPALPALAPPLLGAALLVAGASDALDGWLARRRNEVTRLGLWLDGAADGLVLGVGAMAAARAGLVAGWIAGLVVLRYALPWVAITAVYFWRAAPPSGEGYVSGRLPGAVLVVGLALAAFGASGGEAVAAAGASGSVATLVASILRVRSARAQAARATTA